MSDGHHESASPRVPEDAGSRQAQPDDGAINRGVLDAEAGVWCPDCPLQFGHDGEHFRMCPADGCLLEEGHTIACGHPDGQGRRLAIWPGLYLLAAGLGALLCPDLDTLARLWGAL